MGAEKSEWRAGVLNPWAGTGENGHADPLHPDWDEIDVERLRSVTTDLLGETSSGLLLWIPLRCPEHLDRGAEGRRYGLGKRCPRPDVLCAWFGRSAPAALLLAQCGHLQTIDAERAAGPESLRGRVRLMCVARQTAGWVGRYRDDSGWFADRTFEGEIVSGERSWSVLGTEARGSESLRQLRSQSDWPESPRWQNGRHSTEPRKALAHAAVTVLRPSDSDAELSGSRLRWAVFLRWTTIPSRVPVRSSKATVPRLPGRSSCTATSGRPMTAGPFPASPRILAMPQVMAKCAFVGIGRYATIFCFLCCQAPSSMRLSESTSTQRGSCWTPLSSRTWSRTVWPWSGVGIGSCLLSLPAEFNGKRWTRIRRAIPLSGKGVTGACSAAHFGEHFVSECQAGPRGAAVDPAAGKPAPVAGTRSRQKNGPARIRAPFCRSRGGVRRPRSFAGGSWPLATSAWTMSYSSTTMPPALQMNSTTGPTTASNAC